MKTNEELQRDVQNAIKWEPLLHAAEIGVTVKDGIVSLTGIVDSYAKKVEAENATKNVIGVKAIVEKIEVQVPNTWSKSDVEVANEVLSAFKHNWSIPSDKIKVKVEAGFVTLEGELPWNYQKVTAERAASFLSGVRGISNHITIKADSKETLEKVDIEKALRASTIDDSEITVEVDNTTVTLIGVVNSWAQKEEAGRIAWNTPGIWHVKNELMVDYEYAFT